MDQYGNLLSRALMRGLGLGCGLAEPLVKVLTDDLVHIIESEKLFSVHAGDLNSIVLQVCLLPRVMRDSGYCNGPAAWS